MTILDANILIYAWNGADPRNERARRWIDALFTNEDWIGIPWVTIWAFLRLSTNARVMPQPMTAEQAFRIVEIWLALPNVVTIDPGPRHARILEDLSVSAQATGPLMTDAVLAALAIEHGATLASTDHDFSRFPDLKWINPLAI